MTDKKPDNLQQEINRQSENFREIWGRTPELNRFIFNDKMGKIRQSCSIIESRIQISKELKEFENSLRKTRDRNFIFFFAVSLILFLYDKINFIQSEYYQNLEGGHKTILFSIIMLFITVFTLFSDLSGWLNYNSTKNKFDMIKSFPIYTDSRSGFYKYYVIQQNDYSDEINSAKYNLEYISASLNLLCKVNREIDNGDVELGL